MANTTGKKHGGRTKGTPNKVTQKTRDFISDLLEREQLNILEALEKIRVKDPTEYLKQWNALLEYTTPKLARSELVGDVEKPLSIIITKSYETNQETNKGT
tara:strand:+ start:1157 stop:1459 length:303 start_codon:yes stop_codon:yes gene_type:complete